MHKSTFTMKAVVAATLMAVVAFTAGPSSAEIAAGVKAPHFEAKEFVNTTSVDLQTLAGRVVLLEIFRTW